MSTSIIASAVGMGRPTDTTSLRTLSQSRPCCRAVYAAIQPFLAYFMLTVAGLLFFLLLSPDVNAAEKTFIKEYSYRAGDVDSKVSSRAIAMEQTKRLLLEELGTYLISETEVKNYQITKDQITTLTAGIVRTVIVDESWDGTTYFLRARISVDPAQVASALDLLRKDRARTEELKAAKDKIEDLLIVINKLKKSGDGTQVKTSYTNAVDELSASNLFYEGFSFLRSNNYRDAIESFNRGIALYPRNPESFVNRGFALQKLGNMQAAMNDYTEAIRLNSQKAQAYVFRGGIYEFMGRNHYQPEITYYEKAMQDYQKAITIDSLMDEAYYSLGMLYTEVKGFGFNNPAKGLQFIEIAAKLGNKQAIDYMVRVFLDSGMEAMRQERYNNAIVQFNRALEMNPKSSDAYTLRGSVYSYMGYSKQSVSDYNAAVRFKTDDPATCSSGHEEEISKIMGNSSEYSYLMGKLASNKKNYDEARQHLEMAIRLNSRFTDAYIELSHVYYYQGLYDKRLSILKRAAEIDPGNSEVYLYLAEAYEDNELYNEAIATYKKNLQLAPNDKDSLYALGILYIIQGDKKGVSDLIPVLSKLNYGLGNELKAILARMK